MLLDDCERNTPLVSDAQVPVEVTALRDAEVWPGEMLVTPISEKVTLRPLDALTLSSRIDVGFTERSRARSRRKALRSAAT